MDSRKFYSFMFFLFVTIYVAGYSNLAVAGFIFTLVWALFDAGVYFYESWKEPR